MTPTPPQSGERAEALDAAIVLQALNDWVVTYAYDFAGEDDVAAAQKRLDEFGPLHYITCAIEAAARVKARLAELEIACAQAVEFAEYVEGAAKGVMVDRAKHYLSLPYSQELQQRLRAGDSNGR